MNVKKPRGFKRVLATGDWHSGHQVGLTHPDYKVSTIIGKHSKYQRVREEVWEFFAGVMDKYRPFDVLLLNGDAVEGKGHRSGGTELITPDRNEQCNIASSIVKYINPKNIVMTYGCLTAGHKILTADLRYVPVESLKRGDKLLAFDDNPDPVTHKRYFRESEVVSNGKAVSVSCYKIDLSDGTSITATHDHKFLMNTKSMRGYDWVSVETLYNRSIYSFNKNYPEKRGEHTKYMPIEFKRFIPVWEDEKTYEGGYSAGFFDGEGSLSQRRKGRIRNNGDMESAFTVNATQVDNVALDTCVNFLNKLGFKNSIYRKGGRGEWQECFEIRLLGGTINLLRFMGSIRPQRLLEKFNISKLGCIKQTQKDNTSIINITHVGEQTVYALGTTTETYISEGFLSHNTAYHTGVEEDWEDIIAKDVGAKIGSHEWIDVNGTIIDLKHKIGSSSIPHGRLTSLAREILWNRLWASRGLVPKADILLRNHVHYYEECMHDECRGFILPCMQGFGSKFGARECSGTVDIGVVIFDIYENGEYKWDTEIVIGKSQKANVTKF